MKERLSVLGWGKMALRSWLCHKHCKPLVASSNSTVSVQLRGRSCKGLGKPEQSWSLKLRRISAFF